MITEEMLCEAAAKASEALVAYYEKDYNPQNQPAPPPEFEQRIEDLKIGKMPGLSNIIHRYIKRLSRHLFVPRWQ